MLSGVCLFAVEFLSALVLQQLGRGLGPTAWKLCAFLLGAALLRALGKGIQLQTQTYLETLVSVRLYLSLGYRLLESKLSEVYSASQISSFFDEIFPQTNRFLFYLATSLSTIIQIVALVGALFYFAWRETALLIVVVAAGVLLRKRPVASIVPHAKLARHLQRFFQHPISIRLLGREIPEAMALESDALLQANQNLNHRLRMHLDACGTSLLAVTVLIGVVSVGALVWSTPGLQQLAFLFLAHRTAHLGSHLQLTLSKQRALEHPFLAAKDLLDAVSPQFQKRVEKVLSQVSYFGKSRTPQGIDMQAVQPQLKVPMGTTVQVHALQFRYSTQGSFRLSLEEFTLLAGEKAVIRGPSGNGKSTLLALIGGVLEPEQGAVYLDGLPASKFRGLARGHTAYVGTEPALLEGSLRESLLYGLTPQTDNQIHEALSQVGLLERIRELPLGLETPVWESTPLFSTGEKQRLALARAWLQKPSLLLLDEPSSHLDSASARKVELLIRSMHHTTVVAVSHDENYLAAEKTVVLSGHQTRVS